MGERMYNSTHTLPQHLTEVINYLYVPAPLSLRKELNGGQR
jgi:hypothetical protein